MKRTLSLTLGVFSMIAAVEARAETLEGFKKLIHAKVSAYRSMQYKMHIVTDMTNEQMSFKGVTDQTCEYVRRGDKVLSRVDTKGSTTMTMGETVQKTDITSQDISDGDVAYNYSDAAGQKSATKRKVDPKTASNPFDVMAGFKMIEENYTLKLLSDETLDGKPAFVLEMALKEIQPGMSVSKTRLYYDKSTGISLKSITYDDKGKPTGTMTTTDLKTDVNIPADRFVFKAPPGVTVSDATKGE